MPIYGGQRIISSPSVDPLVEASLASIANTSASTVRYSASTVMYGASTTFYTSSINTYSASTVFYSSSINSYSGSLSGIYQSNVQMASLSRVQSCSFVTATGGLVGANKTLKAIINGVKQTGVVSIMDGVNTLALFDLSVNVGYFDFEYLYFGNLWVTATAPTAIGSGLTVLYADRIA